MYCYHYPPAHIPQSTCHVNTDLHPQQVPITFPIISDLMFDALHKPALNHGWIGVHYKLKSHTNHVKPLNLQLRKLNYISGH